MNNEVWTLLAGSALLLVGLGVFVAGKIPALLDAVRHQRYGWSGVLALSPLFPPLGMAVWDGGITNKFWISLLLTLLFYLPGLIYVLLQILG